MSRVDETLLEHLREYFKRFGEIEEVRVIKDKSEGLARGFGFVLFKNRMSYNRVFEASENHEVLGRRVKS